MVDLFAIRSRFIEWEINMFNCTNRHKASAGQEIRSLPMRPRHERKFIAREIVNPVNETSVLKIVMLEDKIAGKIYKMKHVAELIELYRVQIDFLLLKLKTRVILNTIMRKRMMSGLISNKSWIGFMGTWISYGPWRPPESRG